MNTRREARAEKLQQDLALIFRRMKARDRRAIDWAIGEIKELHMKKNPGRRSADGAALMLLAIRLARAGVPPQKWAAQIPKLLARGDIKSRVGTRLRKSPAHIAAELDGEPNPDRVEVTETVVDPVSARTVRDFLTPQRQKVVPALARTLSSDKTKKRK